MDTEKLTPRKKRDSLRMVSYAKFPKDAHGYTSAQHKPGIYDLVTTVDEEGKKRKGWWTGYSWDGFKIKQGTIIVKWKRNLEDYCSK